MMHLSNPQKHRPEAKVQDAIESMLKIKDWYIKRTHGNIYQSGFADIFACHHVYGQRWIEVKLPGMKGSKFTPAQLESFPKFCAHGSGVWVLTAATEEEYAKLFKAPNWWQYLDIMR
jgi:hypothetical protein